MIQRDIFLKEKRSTMTIDIEVEENNVEKVNSSCGEDGEVEDGEGGLGGAGAAKTPVSLLQELYVRRGLTPKYDLVQIEGAVHEPTFKYRVTIGEFVASGCGQSKKKAKHSAAKAILDKVFTTLLSSDHSTMLIVTRFCLQLIGAQNSGKAPVGQPPIPDLATEILSPYDDGIQGNPVGLLQVRHAPYLL